MWTEEALADQKIIEVKVKSPSVWLKTEAGTWIEVEAVGDCCSEAFIDAVRLDGTPVLTGASQEINFLAQPTTQDCDQLYAVRFDGHRGGVSVLHRNSSNGFYGNFLSVTARGEPPADAEDGTDWYRKT